MKGIALCLKLLLIYFLLITASPLYAGEVRISVAASMTDLFKALITTYAQNNPEIKIIPNFGSSGGLAKQISQGAPVDLYVSANPTWMNFLEEQKMIEVSSKKAFAHNTLVFVGRTEKGVSSLTDLVPLERIGIGSPTFVPAGQYARQALQKSGLYDNLRQSGKLAMAKDVRQALIYADRGETDGSFVYYTDALLARHAIVLFEVNQELYDKITYPVAITALGLENPDVKGFYDFVTSVAAHDTIRTYGFSLPQK